MLLAIVASSGTIFANRVKIDGLWYILNAEQLTAEITYEDINANYSDLSFLTIPEFVAYDDVNYTVTSIGESAFLRCVGLTGVSIPSSVINIGNTAFSSCTSLSNVDIPNSVKSLGAGAFSSCSSLASVSIGNGISSIDEATFAFCKSLTSVELPESLETIGREAFRYCNSLRDIVIPASVTSIGYRAFQFSGLINVDIPDNVTTIATEAFDFVVNINYSSSASGSPWGARSMNGYWDGSLIFLDSSKTTLVACSPEASGEIDVPKGVTSILYYAFFCCAGMTGISIPESVEYIGYAAFMSCTGLKSITIPNGVRYLDDELFYGCSNLTTLTIGSSVQNIRNGVFVNCAKLNTIYNYSDTPQPINGRQFNGWDVTGCTLYVPKPSVSLYRYAEGWKHCMSIIGIDVPNDFETPVIDSQRAAKTLLGGQILILREGKMYTMQGLEVR